MPPLTLCLRRRARVGFTGIAEAKDRAGCGSAGARTRDRSPRPFAIPNPGFRLGGRNDGDPRTREQAFSGIREFSTCIILYHSVSFLRGSPTSILPAGEEGVAPRLGLADRVGGERRLRNGRVSWRRQEGTAGSGQEERNRDIPVLGGWRRAASAVRRYPPSDCARFASSQSASLSAVGASASVVPRLRSASSMRVKRS